MIFPFFFYFLYILYHKIPEKSILQSSSPMHSGSVQPEKTYFSSHLKFLWQLGQRPSAENHTASPEQSSKKKFLQSSSTLHCGHIGKSNIFYPLFFIFYIYYTPKSNKSQHLRNLFPFCARRRIKIKITQQKSKKCSFVVNF